MKAKPYLLAHTAAAFLISLALPWVHAFAGPLSPINAVGTAIDLSRQASAAGVNLSDFMHSFPDAVRGLDFETSAMAVGFVLAWALALIMSIAAVPFGLLGKWPTWAGVVQGLAVSLATAGVLYGAGRIIRESAWGVPRPSWAEALSTLPMGIWLSLVAGLASIAVALLIRSSGATTAPAVSGTTTPN